ncbi:MAG: DUF1841 family protein [Gammaproteobacteria bacterium]|nr:DUF1841 family protein [Gammaproteobacteria bacterium]
MFGSDRNSLRTFYKNSWQKHQQALPLSKLEQQVVTVIAEHPEYQAQVLADNASHRDWAVESGDTNPFLHMGMHLALREQIATDRPAGIARCYHLLCQSTQAALEAEHQMMECLGQALWQAQRNNTMPDEASYLNCLQTLTQDCRP